jgi:DNA uptake protein ComE-like DNA-binding protein
MSTKVYKPSGVKIDVISTHDDGEYLMVRSNTTGKVFFAHKDQVDVFQEDTEPKATSNSVSVRRGRRNFKKDEPEAPVVIKPLPPIDNRINLNNLTAEGLTQCLPGVGLKTAKEIIELRQSLPGERFTKLDQLSSIKRVDWDEVFATGSVYVE